MYQVQISSARKLLSDARVHVAEAVSDRHPPPGQSYMQRDPDVTMAVPCGILEEDAHVPIMFQLLGRGDFNHGA